MNPSWLTKGNLVLWKFPYIGIFSVVELFDPKFTEDRSAFTSHPPPLIQKPHKHQLSLLLIPTKSRRARSNGSTLRKLRTQENKISTLQNMISLNNASWHPNCVTEVNITKLDRVLTLVAGKVKYQPKSSTHLQKFSVNQPLPDKTKKAVEDVFRQT